MNNYLLDKDFLYELDQSHHKEIYARIIALDFDEQPIEQIEGKVTGGTVNIDGSSAVRRSCSLSLIAYELNINDFYWGLTNKFQLEIGIKNNINSNYPDIIWFNQGIYVISAFNTSLETGSYNISISGKDKMCLLNGEMGGSLSAPIDFGCTDYNETKYIETEVSAESSYSAHKYYIYDKTNKEYKLSDDRYDAQETYYTAELITTTTKLPLYTIIREAVHTYGQEPYSNIVINDLEANGLELLEYRGDKSLYLLYSEDSGIYTNMTTNGDVQCYVINKNQRTSLDSAKKIYSDDVKNAGKQLELAKANYLNIDGHTEEDWNKSTEREVALQARQTAFNTAHKICEQAISNLVGGATALQDIRLNSKIDRLDVSNDNEDYDKFVILEDDDFNLFSAVIIDNCAVAGYRETELVYAGDLMASAGEPLTSVLDKIKNMLGDFEYFYDLDGRFIFQRKRTYINSSWNSIKTISTDRLTNDDIYADNAAGLSSSVYSFEDNNLITSFQNTPDLNNMCNDFSVWGERDGTGDNKINVHARVAIDKKPWYYKNYNGMIYTTSDTWKTQLSKSITDTITKKYKAEIFNYTPEHPVEAGFTRPKRLEDGSWSAGWWDIRDWYNYYYILTKTVPNLTMKWYSRGNSNNAEEIASGYVPVNDLVKNGANIEQRYYGEYAWLAAQESTQNGRFSFIHGHGNPSGRSDTCTCQYSILNEDGTIKTEKCIPIDTRVFTPPYCGCADNHTYLYFWINYIQQGKKVYFYNPKFPGVDDYETLIQQQIDIQVAEYFESNPVSTVDWREIIYQMALDYYKHNEEDDFLVKIAKNNRNVQYINLDGLVETQSYYTNGITGYENYYTDLQAFWRELYNPDAEITYPTSGGQYITKKQVDVEKGTFVLKNEWIDYIVDKTVAGSCDYFQEYDDAKAETLRKTDHDAYVEYQLTHSKEYKWWHTNVVYAPYKLNFWLEFLDDAGELAQYSIPAIGSRPKVVNDNDITAIYFRETPLVIYATKDDIPDPEDRKTGYTYVRVSNQLMNLFTVSAQGKSAKDSIDELLYNYTYCTESISLTTLPVYYLEPNTRIFIHDDKSNINGEYIVDRISVPLTFNGTMSISAVKAVDRLY